MAGSAKIKNRWTVDGRNKYIHSMYNVAATNNLPSLVACIIALA
jgi:hypothetical protein